MNRHSAGGHLQPHVVLPYLEQVLANHPCRSQGRVTGEGQFFGGGEDANLKGAVGLRCSPDIGRLGEIELARAIGEGAQLAGAIEQGILGVNVQVDKFSVRHAGTV